MIFYFSATGNSEWVAKQLAAALDDPHVFPMSSPAWVSEQLAKYGREDDPIGIVFPVHAWGVPDPVQKVIEGFPDKYAFPYIYMVCTCGDDAGYTAKEFDRLLARRSQTCQLAYSVCMPESYVCLPGFDVDTPQREQQKLNEAEAVVQEIARCVAGREQGEFVKEGPFPGLKSGLFRRFFNRYLVDDRFFHVDNDRCVGCGKCAKSCPLENIIMEKGRPKWMRDQRCITCMSCYHRCPTHAIRFGWFTRNKGQYLHPDQ